MSYQPYPQQPPSSNTYYPPQQPPYQSGGFPPSPKQPYPLQQPMYPPPPMQQHFAATHGTPRLGSLLSDFVGKYGQPNDHSDKMSYHFLRAANGPADGLIAWSLNTERTNYVNDVTVATTDRMQWTSNDARAKCMTFAPADAHLKQRFDYADGKGYDLVYTSTQLAHDFPANEFTDASAVNQVRAGTFDVSYLYTSDGRHIDSCDMIIGEQQTSD